MEIIVRCHVCDKELEILETGQIAGSYNLLLKVKPCKSKGCTDCSECEDMKLLKIYREGEKQLQTQLKEYYDAQVREVTK